MHDSYPLLPIGITRSVEDMFTRIRVQKKRCQLLSILGVMESNRGSAARIRKAV
jgi:hypothetical protein